MIHGKALGQYKIIREGETPSISGFVFTVVNALGEVVCLSFDSQLEAVNHIINVLLPMERN